MSRAWIPAVCAAAVALALLPAAGSAQAIRKLPNITGLVYSPDSVVKGTGSITIRSGGYIGPFCVVFTLLSLTPAVSAPAENLSFGLYKTAASPSYALAMDGNPTSADEVLSGDFPLGSAKAATVVLSMAALVSPLRLPPPNSYTAQVQASLYASAYPPSGTAIDTSTFTVKTSVASHYDLSLVPSGSGFSLSSTSQGLSFGALVPGDSRGADIVVRTNVAYTLSITSANGGALSNAADPASQVGYTLRANGNAVALAAGLPSPIVAGSPATYSGYSRYALVFTILDFPDLPSAGNYSDTLTLTLTAP
jgi:hypothetical protein